MTVTDEVGAFDFHNFTLTVYLTSNQPPKITTEDKLTATVNITYSVDYDATDDRTLIDRLRWSLETNASWLGIDPDTGVLSGTPKLKDVGSYWVKVSVFDGEDGWDHHEFTLRVFKIPIKENNVPVLSNPTMTPSEGDVETEFTFTVHYYDDDSDAPTFIQVVIDNKSYNMTLESGNLSNGTYEYSTKLSKGTHIYYFTASDGVEAVETDEFTTPYIDKVNGKISQEEFSWLWLILIITVIIIVLIIVFLIIRRKRIVQEEEPPEEEQPPTEGPIEDTELKDRRTEELSLPPLEQPSTLEIQQEQPLLEVPTPEVPPQVPQVEESPASMPQVEEQPVPTPQIDQSPQVQPQVEPQEAPMAESPTVQQSLVEQMPVPKIIQSTQQAEQSPPKVEDTEE